MRVTQTISIGTIRINAMSNSSIVQIGTSGAVKTRSEEITEVIPQAEANQKLEKKIDNSVKPHLAKEGIPTAQQPLGTTDTGGKGPGSQQQATSQGTAGGTGGGAGSAPITGATSGAPHGDIGSEGSPNSVQPGTGGGAGGNAGVAGNGTGKSVGSNGAGNSSGYGVGIDSSSWYVDQDAKRHGRGRGGTSDAANRGKTRT